MQISIKNSFPELIKELKKMPDKIQEQIIKPALKDAANVGKTQLIRSIGQNYNLSRPEISSTFKVKVEPSKSSILNGGIKWRASISSTTRRPSLNMIRFVERKVSLAQGRKRKKSGTQNQLHVKIKRTGGVKPMGNRVFIGNKGRTVFKRIKGQYMASRKGRTKHSEKIKAVSTINIPAMMKARRIMEPAVEKIKQNFLSRLDHYSKRVLSKSLKIQG